MAAESPVSLDRVPLPPIARLRHVLSTREGGVSTGPYAALNLGAHVGDDPACVAENRRRLAAAAGYDADRLVSAQQTHSTNVATVTAADRGCGALDWAGAIPDTDALLVRDPGTPTAILVADCAPLLIVDVERHALVNVHAGWRGALDRIAFAAVHALLREAGSRPGELLVGIGPTLCPACLEIGHDIAEYAAAQFGPNVLDQAEKPHLRIRDVLVADLYAAGIPREQVFISPDCPRCRNDRYFSHRGQDGTAGRFGLIAWWEE